VSISLVVLVVELQEHPQRMRWKRSRHLSLVKMQVIAGFGILVVTVDYTLEVESGSNPKVRYSMDKIRPESSCVRVGLWSKFC
jgi:hypothetical protein